MRNDMVIIYIEVLLIKQAVFDWYLPFHLTVTAPNLTKFTSLDTADSYAPGGYKMMANGYEFSVLHTEYYSNCENEPKFDLRGKKINSRPKFRKLL